MKIGRTNACGGGSIEHNDTLNRNNDPNFLHITQKEKNDFVNASDFAINHNSSKDTHLGSIWNPIKLQQDATSTDATDLNDLISPGVYYQAYSAGASVDLHYPEPLAGALIVVSSVGGGVNQIYTTYNDGEDIKIYIRGYYNTRGWSAWKKIIDEEDLNSAIGDINDNLNNKVTKETGKGLSSNDLTDELKDKIEIQPTPLKNATHAEDLYKIMVDQFGRITKAVKVTNDEISEKVNVISTEDIDALEF